MPRKNTADLSYVPEATRPNVVLLPRTKPRNAALSKFRYPTARPLSPIDEIAGQIVRALGTARILGQCTDSESGIQVLSATYRIGKVEHYYVREVSGREFILKFGRENEDPYCDTIMLGAVTIPKYALVLSNDISGISCYVYTGTDSAWETNRETFMRGPKVSSRANYSVRLYLRYDGVCNCRRGAHPHHEAHKGEMPQFLAFTSDPYREYPPRCGEPQWVETEEILAWFYHWLKDNVLNRL